MEKVQLTFDSFSTGEKGEVCLVDPEIKIQSFLDIEASRVEEVKLPLQRGEEIKLPKKNIFSVEGVTLSILGQKLYNFKVQWEEGIGRRGIVLKGRECRITFEGTVNPNGSVGMTKLKSYFICKELSFKRALEVYSFVQKMLAGNEMEVRGEGVNFSVELPQKLEYLKLLKLVDILYKYHHITKIKNFSNTEKVGFIFKNAKKVNEISMILSERSVDTMVSMDGKELAEIGMRADLKIVKKGRVKLKNNEILYKKTVKVPGFVLETNEEGGKVSASWKKAKVEYKKVLD